MLEAEGVVDGEVTWFGWWYAFGGAAAVVAELALVAVWWCGAVLEDVDDGPSEDGAFAEDVLVYGWGCGVVLVVGVVEECGHDAVGAVEGGEGFDGAVYELSAELFGACGELCGVPDVVVEEVDFVASEFVRSYASYGGV